MRSGVCATTGAVGARWLPGAGAATPSSVPGRFWRLAGAPALSNPPAIGVTVDVGPGNGAAGGATIGEDRVGWCWAGAGGGGGGASYGPRGGEGGS